jgi:hypothetical protein
MSNRRSRQPREPKVFFSEAASSDSCQPSSRRGFTFGGPKLFAISRANPGLRITFELNRILAIGGGKFRSVPEPQAMVARIQSPAAETSAELAEFPATNGPHPSSGSGN